MTGDSSAVTKLWQGASNGDLAQVRAAVKEGADINASNWQGYSAIHNAAGALMQALRSKDDCLEFIKTIEWLVANDANVNAVGAHGLRPLHILAGNPVSDEQDRSIVVPLAELLLKKGAKVNAKAGDAKQTAMHYTSVHGRDAMIELLLKFEAAVNPRNYRGETPLHLAAQTNKERAIRLLVEAGAMLGARDKTNRTPLDIAEGVKRVVIGTRVMPVIVISEPSVGHPLETHAVEPKKLEPRVRQLLSNRPRRS